MFVVNVNLNSIDGVKEFVNIMSKKDFDADLVSDRYVIDAKSIMGIFSLDLTKSKELHVHTDDQKVFDEFKAEIAKFIA